jgi:hypothetical protein
MYLQIIIGVYNTPRVIWLGSYMLANIHVPNNKDTKIERTKGKFNCHI